MMAGDSAKEWRSPNGASIAVCGTDQTRLLSLELTSTSFLELGSLVLKPLREGPLLDYGAVLIRGSDIREPENFEIMVGQLGRPLLTYDYASTPRKRIAGQVFSSTEYPRARAIPQHNEQSYTCRWPGLIWFYCAKAASEAGRTPIADSRAVYRCIEPSIRERFRRKGLLYIRNYGGGLDLPWQDVFQSADPRQVESYCAREGITCEWLGADRLRTRQLCQSEIIHPLTGELVWFNQAHLFHVSGLDPATRHALLSIVDEADLPRNVCYGDGTVIEDDVLDHIRSAYQAVTFAFPWQDGDVLVLDNMLMTHGREPFAGDRSVLVAMTEPYRFETSTKRVLAVDEPALPQEVVS